MRNLAYTYIKYEVVLVKLPRQQKHERTCVKSRQVKSCLYFFLLVTYITLQNRLFMMTKYNRQLMSTSFYLENQQATLKKSFYLESRV